MSKGALGLPNYQKSAARRAVFLVACALALAGLTAGSASAGTGPPPGEPRQPYWVWDTADFPFGPVPVDLSDQFNDLSVAVDRCEYLMNPVAKEGVTPPTPFKGFVDPDLHYSWNRINPPPKCGATQVRNVRITDQFGVNVWTICRQPTYLLAPTDKCVGPPCPLVGVPANQHYACYQAVKSPFVGDVVNLQDQFDIQANQVVGLGAWVCAPVSKTVDPAPPNPDFPINASGLHLSCYTVPPDPNFTSWEAEDQFGTFSGNNQFDAFLCVDAAKELPLSQVPTMGPWGLATLGGLMGLLAMVWYARRRATGGEAA